MSDERAYVQAERRARRQRISAALVLATIGAGIASIGVALISIPIALIVVGVAVAALGLLAIEVTP